MLQKLVSLILMSGLCWLVGCSTTPKRQVEDLQLSDLNAITKGLQIALVLPTSGTHAKMAKAIQAGFLNAYYEQQSSQNRLFLLNSQGTVEGVQAAYQQAQEKKANWVVGPLSKEAVKALSDIPPKLPVLAFNALPKRNPSGFYTLSLSPLEEIQALVAFIRGVGHRKVVLVGLDAHWSQRIVQDFQKQFEKAGGKILKKVQVQKAHKQTQFNTIATAYQHEPESSPHLPDAFVVVASADDLKQLKPLLDYHYRPETPMFSMANIYGGKPNPLYDQDLNGVIFCDMPWVIDKSLDMQNQRQNSQGLLGQTPSQTARWFALGMDAFTVLNHWTALQSGASIQGMSGRLVLNPLTQTIERGLICARFEQGEPKPIGK